MRIAVVDKRKFIGSICVRYGTTRARIELSPAEMHGGPAGSFRLRLYRKWMNDDDGNMLFFDAQRLGGLIGSIMTDFDVPVPEAPDIPQGSGVSGKYWDETQDWPRTTGTFTNTPPVLLHSGVWHVGCHIYGKGFIWIPCDDVVVIKKKPSAR